MSASGFTPVPGTSTASSTSPATSSSHQPPTKSLRALDEAEDGQESVKVITDSTDDDLLPEQVAHPVTPAVVTEGEGQPKEEPEGEHEADSFVPNSNREETLEVNSHAIHTKTEVFEIGSEDPEEGVKAAAKEDVQELTPVAPAVEGSKATSSAVATDVEGPQPTPSTDLRLQSSAVHSACSSFAPAQPSQSDELGFTIPFKSPKTL